jgi:glycosyltransferase involved in cell wall biosynthesis
MEAMACGVVPLVPDLGDLPRIVDHGKTGYLYQAGDTSSLEELLAELIVDDGKRQSIGQRAGEFAMAHSWDSIAANVLEHVRVDSQTRSRVGVRR